MPGRPPCHVRHCCGGGPWGEKKGGEEGRREEGRRRNGRRSEEKWGGEVKRSGEEKKATCDVSTQHTTHSTQYTVHSSTPSIIILHKTYLPGVFTGRLG